MSTATLLTEHSIKVLLIDDQPLIGEIVRRMLANEPDIGFHYCKDPTRVLETAREEYDVHVDLTDHVYASSS